MSTKHIDRSDQMAATINAGQLLEDAIASAGLDDFGAVNFTDDVRAYVRAINAESNLTLSGADGLSGFLTQLLINRLRVQRDLVRHPQIRSENVSDPIVVTGLFRTGTTKLQRMMSADPRNQALTFWKIFNPAPFPDARTGEPDPRLLLARRYVDQLATHSRDYMACHPWLPEDADEDSLLLWLTFDHLANASAVYVPSFVQKVLSDPQQPNYEYLALLLSYLQWQEGGRHGPWILKSPTHIGNLPPLFEAFPNATVVHCHRDPVTVVPSIARMFELFWGLFGCRVGLDQIGRFALNIWAREMEKNLSQRLDVEAKGKIVDVRFRDIVARPLEVISTIYEAHGAPSLDDAAEHAILAWEKNNPPDLFGKNQYSLKDFGLTETMVRHSFATYIDNFGKYF